ncbi:hypothetical protein FRC04_011320 [Tulasnella sp. 424]|nr:hypothetical protein FRC04_011320 [Tulasnella sp. 424]
MQAAVLREAPIIPVVPTFERMKGTEALTIPEILRAILDHAAPPTLASAARVSRAWLTVALDKLWSDHDVKVIDLLRILPLELTMYKEYYGEALISYWKPQRDPTNEEWTRFQSYASRIRLLSMPDGDIPDADLPRFDPSITEWKLKNDVLFPRPRRVDWSIPIKLAIPSSGLSSFATSDLQELSLIVLSGWWTAPEVVTSTLHDLTTIEGLRLKKFKLTARGVDLNLGHAIADFITTQQDSLQTLEIQASCRRISPLGGQSLGNLTALDIHIPRGEDGAGAVNAIQKLVEGCPRVSYLKIRITDGIFDIDFSNLRAMLDCRDGKSLAKVEEVRLKCRPPTTNFDVSSDSLYPGFRRFQLSLLADIISSFSELEELGAEFRCDLDEHSLPDSSHLSSLLIRGSRLRKLRLGLSSLRGAEQQRDTMARFIAAVCPPGLHIARSYLKPPSGNWGDLLWVEAEGITVAGRDADPEWDDLFQKIEELHGGVKIWVGSIPEEDDGVWF